MEMDELSARTGIVAAHKVSATVDIIAIPGDMDATEVARARKLGMINEDRCRRLEAQQPWQDHHRVVHSWLGLKCIDRRGHLAPPLAD